MGYHKSAFVFYPGIKTKDELLTYIQHHNKESPPCVMFAELSETDKQLGYIEEVPLDVELWNELPKTLKEALNAT